MAESDESKEKRAAWMEQARFNRHCPCTTMPRLDYTQLKRTAAQMQRIVNNEKPQQHDLNDNLDDMFPGPYILNPYIK